MYKIAICDDEEPVRVRLNQYTQRLMKELGVEADIQIYESGDRFLCDTSENPDLIFLDIRMEGTDGMQTARKIRERNKNVCIIFVTSMVQYAMEAFKVRAFGFLKKPLTYEEFSAEVREALQKIGSWKAEKEIQVKTSHGIKRVVVQRIQCVEVQNHEIILWMGVAEIRFYGKLKEMEEQLKGQGFLRCHSGFLVNCAHIQEIRPLSVLLENGMEVPISKYRKKEFMEALTAWAGDHL